MTIRQHVFVVMAHYKVTRFFMVKVRTVTYHLSISSDKTVCGKAMTGNSWLLSNQTTNDFLAQDPHSDNNYDLHDQSYCQQCKAGHAALTGRGVERG